MPDSDQDGEGWNRACIAADAGPTPPRYSPVRWWVASTSQIGRIEVVKVENKGKGFRRLRVRLTDT